MFDQIRDISLEAVSALLAFFYQLPVVGGSYGIAIILLTGAVMIILMPLTLKATSSTIKMTQLQPELKRLQKEHKDDRQALNQEMMALYQKNGVNPVGGCLPMLAQLPVFLLLFNVLRGLSRRNDDLPYYQVATLAQEKISEAAVVAGDAEMFAPKYLSQDSELYQALAQETEIGFGGILDLSAHPWDVLNDNVITAIPYLLLILFVVGSSYYQQRQISARRGAQPENPTPQQQTQQQLLRILPLMSGIWSFLFPTGLVLYWATSNLFRIGQQAYITRSLYSEEAQAALKESIASGITSDDDLVDDGKPGSPKSSAKSSAGDANRSNRDSRDNGSKGGGKGDRGSKGGAKAGAGASGQANGSVGGRATGDGNGSAPADRNEAWARRRAERAKTRPRKPASSGGGAGASGRVTPKGTKPTDNRKKRKR